MISAASTWIRAQHVWVLLVAAGWLAAHPYAGVVFDARLYAVEALRQLNPAAYETDLFFRYGSQDSYSIFSALYTRLVGSIGLDASSHLVLIAGHLAWLGFALALIARLLPHRALPLAMAVLASLPSTYGGLDLFHFGESFVTPRLLAEALSLGALAALLAARYGWFAVLAAAAFALHPLMTMGPLLAAVLFVAMGKRQWLAIVAALIALGLLLLAVRPGPIATLLPVMDGEWRSIAEQRSRHLFLANWSLADGLRIVEDAALLASAAWLSSGAARRFYLAVLVAGALSLMAAWVGADWLSISLVVKAQVWRTLWLVHVLALMGFAHVLFATLAEQRRDRELMIMVVCLALTLLMTRVTPAAHLSAVIGSLTVCGQLLLRQALPLTGRVLALLAVVAAALGAYLCFIQIQSVIAFPGTVPGDADSTSYWLVWLPSLIAGVAIAACVFPAQSPMVRNAAGLLALGLVLLAASHWDRRSPWRQYMDGTPDLAAVMSGAIRSGEQVYWQGDVMAAWGGLRRANYFHKTQGAGVVFNRATALAYRDRSRQLEPFDDGAALAYSLSYIPVFKTTTAGDVKALCGLANGPDVLVLNQAVSGLSGTRWTPPVPYPELYRKREESEYRLTDLLSREVTGYFIYRCSEL